MSADIAFTIDAREGMRRVAAAFERMPAAAERAMTRALKKLSTWLKRQSLRAAAGASGIPQKFFEQAMRYYVTVERAGSKPVGVSVWVGTNPIPQHRLGQTVWTPYMPGARRIEGKARTWRAAWTWGAQGKTGPAIMQRTGSARLPIARVPDELPHPVVLEALGRLKDEASTRFDRLLVQELNYALNVEASR